jgi:hypothetical protein
MVYVVDWTEQPANIGGRFLTPKGASTITDKDDGYDGREI